MVQGSSYNQLPMRTVGGAPIGWGPAAQAEAEQRRYKVTEYTTRGRGQDDQGETAMRRGRGSMGKYGIFHSGPYRQLWKRS